LIRLLLIEDTANAASWRDTLRGQGYAVDHVKHASDAFLLEKPNSYDVVVVDCAAPSIDDLIFSKTFHKERLTPPVVFLTGRSSALDGVNGGGDDYVMKEATFPELIATLAELNKS